MIRLDYQPFAAPWSESQIRLVRPDAEEAELGVEQSDALGHDRRFLLLAHEQPGTERLMKMS